MCVEEALTDASGRRRFLMKEDGRLGIAPWTLNYHDKYQAWIMSSSQEVYVSGEKTAIYRNAIRLALGRDGLWTIIDLTLATLSGSDTLRPLVEALRDAKKQGKGFVIVFPHNGMVHKIFQLAGLDSIFTFFFTLDEALEYIGRQ